MANLEYIRYQPWREEPSGAGFEWQEDAVTPVTPKLPQLFWASGDGWAEANHWALGKIIEDGSDIETVKALMKHVRAYANFLEEKDLDWRHFPVQLKNRAVVRFRGHLMRLLESGTLSSSTARSRINAVVQFYRHAARHDFIESATPMWREKPVVIRFYDSAGFKRSISRMSTDLAISSRAVVGVRLEDGLIPLSDEHMTELLSFTSARETTELHLMLMIGFFTGARLGTISSLGLKNLLSAREDPFMKGFYLVRVGPGTGVSTKFDVEGELLFPKALMDELKRYAYSTERLKREAKANPADRSVLFLTTRGRRYSNSAISCLMTHLRRKALRSNMRFMQRFKFHQTRATYGTWLMKICLSVTTPGAAIEFVKNAMLHKNEATTFRYIRFLETTKGKQEAAKAFHEAFTGLTKRNWNEAHA